MNIASAPAVGCESRGDITSVPTASPEMYITGVPTVGCESRDVYRWCARCRMQV